MYARRVLEKRTKMTLLMAVGMQGVVGWELWEGNCNKETFAQFVNNLQLSDIHQYLLMDNVVCFSFHYAEPVKRALKTRGISPLFLPPYTPQWQPIEHVFHTLKHCCRMSHNDAHPTNNERAHSLTTEDRVTAAISCIDGSSDQPFSRTFRHCWRLIQSCQLYSP